MNKKFLLLAALILAAPAWSADERAKTDRSTRTHTLIVVDDVTGEIRQLKSDANGLKVSSTGAAGSATEAKQDDQITELQAILAKILAAPATEAKQDSAITELQSILAKLIAAPATEAKQDTGNSSLASIAAEDFATQTTLAAVLAKIIAAPSTEAKQDSAITELQSILAKIIAAPSTEAKQDTMITSLGTIAGDTTSLDAKVPAQGQALMAASVPVAIASDQSAIPVSGTVTANIGTTGGLGLDSSLASILAKIIAAPATEAKQDTGNSSLASIAAEDFATQTTLAAILAKILAAPATEAKQDTGNTSLATLAGTVTGNEIQADIVTDPPLVSTTDTVGSVDNSNQLLDGTTLVTVQYGVIDDALSGNNTLEAAVVGKKIRILSMLLISNGDVDVRFEDGAGGTALTGQMDLTTNSGFSLPYSPVGHFETGVNTLLNMELSGAVSVDGSYTFILVD